MLMNDERLLLTLISRVPIPTWTLQHLVEHDQLLFWHLHKAGLLEPSADYERYGISERGRTVLDGGTERERRADFQHTRNGGGW